MDVFRYLHPTQERAYTCWSTILECRKSNHGTRIDLIATSPALARAASCCEVWQHEEGSDHCPVYADFALRTLPARRPPSLSSAHYSHKQKKLSAFLISRPQSQDPQAQECPLEAQGERSLRAPKRSAAVDSKVLPQAKLKKSSSQPTPATAAASESRGLLSLFSTPDQKAKADTQQPAFTSDSDGGVDSIDRSQLDSQLGLKGAAEPLLLPSSQPPSLNMAWKSVFGAAPKPPLCRGHREPCKLMTVKKAGPNKDRQFWKCPRPGGSKGDPQANCNFFQWASKQSFKKS